MDTVTVSEGDFLTNDQAYSLFELVEGLGMQNNYFVAMRDTAKDGVAYGVAGGAGAIAGAIAANAMDKKNALANVAFDGLLINDTEAGLGIIPLVNKGMVMSFNPSKMTAKPNRYFFIPNEAIKEIIVKNYNILNPKVKRFEVKLADGTKISVLLRAKEKDVAYQSNAIEKLMAKYGKK